MELSTSSNSRGTAPGQRWKYSGSNKHFKMKNPLASCTHERVYQDLKRFSKNGDHVCKQLLSVLQQRADLEITYAKGLEKLTNKLTKVLDKMKFNYLCNAWFCVSEGMKTASDLHSKLGKAIQTEAINPTNCILEEQEKRKKAAKKKLKELTKDHEILFRATESSQQLASPKTKKKLLRSLEKSAIKLAKDDADYYEKNLAACETRLRWETALENCHQASHLRTTAHNAKFAPEVKLPPPWESLSSQHHCLCKWITPSILNLEKERLGLLCNMLNRYSQHLSSFGESLIECHARIRHAVGEVDTEKDTQKLLEEMAVPLAEEKSEFLLADYYVSDTTACCYEGQL
ncbi:hypothetical protein lerEdw1_017398 [Lerista edwardsae]|nr:hypothetical protein lerEdw1_017398 [Lerista edwardsae]